MLRFADAFANWIPGVVSNAFLIIAVTAIWTGWKKRFVANEKRSEEIATALFGSKEEPGGLVSVVKDLASRIEDVEKQTSMLPELVAIVKTVSRRVDIAENQTSDLGLAINRLNMDGQKFVTVERNSTTVNAIHEKQNETNIKQAKLETKIEYLEREIQRIVTPRT